MALCKHLLGSGCADCAPVPPAVLPRPASWLEYGPWFGAGFPGDCDGCGDSIEPGDRIRADGENGWLCEDCGSAEPGHAGMAGPAPERPILEYQGQPAQLSLAAFLEQHQERL